jgi:hypothetical protein
VLLGGVADRSQVGCSKAPIKKYKKSRRAMGQELGERNVGRIPPKSDAHTFASHR